MQIEANRATKGIVAIALGAFAVVTTEFIVVGLLPLIAADLAVPIGTVGLLVSVYAFTVVPSAPLLTVLPSKLCRRKCECYFDPRRICEATPPPIRRRYVRSIHA